MLLLTAALVGPYFINWTSYRAEFEAEASKILGRAVTVEGEASARLLPFPSVTFENVTVAGAEPGQPGMTVEAFSMDAELAPFMSGEFRIFDMRLVRPHMTITVDQGGAIDWAVRPSTPVDPRQISVETLTITDGQVDLVHGPSGRTHVLAGLDATLSARTLAGPWRMDGTASLDDLPTKLAVATGAVDEGGGMRLRITATPDAYPLTLDLDGSLRFEDTRPSYSGTLRFNAQNELAQPIAEGEAAKPAGPPDYRLTGAFTLTSDRLALDAARFETGPLDNPYTADGTAELSLNAEPRFRISADGAQVRFDETVAGADSQGVTLEQRIAALERVVNALPRPTIPGTVDVNLPAVVAGDTTIRDVRLSAQPAPEGWSLDTFAATLPGRTTLEGSGLLRAGADFGFSGKLLLAVAQPSGFAAWLSKDVNEAIRVLPAAGFDASVEMSRTRQQFRDLELQLGDARFRGELDRRQPGDARPSIAVRLDGDALDVDGLAAFASIFVSDQGQTRLADHDLDFNVKAGPVRASGLVAESLDTALRLRNDRLEIDRLAIGGLAGASISATGRIDHLGSQPTGDIDASLIATDLAPLITQLAARYPGAPLLGELADRAAAYPGLFADTQLDLIGSAARGEGQARGLALSAHGTSGGTAMQLTASTANLARSAAEMPIEMSLNAITEDGASLVALAGLPSLPLGLLGRAEATLTLNGSPREGLRTSVLLRGEDIDAGFDGQVLIDEAGTRANGEARLTAGDIEPWLMTTGMGISGMGLGTPVGVAGQVTLADGKLTTQIEGSWNHGDVQGTVATEVIEGRPHFSGNLSMAHLGVEDAVGLVLGADSQTPESDGGWSRKPFANAASLPFTTDLSIATTQFEVGPGRFVTDAAFGLRLDDDGLRFSNLTGRYGGGRVGGLVSLQNSGGSGLLSAQLEFADADIATVTGQPVLGGRADFGVSVSASGKSVEGMVAALSGSGTARLRGLAMTGLNPDALPALLAAADKVGRTVDDAAVADFAPPILGQGNYAAGDAEIALTIANGALRMPQTQFAASASTLSAELVLDAVRETVAGRATVAYAPGDNALVGSEPTVSLDVSGPVEAPGVSYDTAALSQYLTQRALEIEQARVEAMQAQLLEQQRLRREVRYYAALQSAREEAERLRLEEEARLGAEEDARAQAEEAARLQAEQEARAAAEAETARQEMERREAEGRQAAERRQAEQRTRQEPAQPPAQTREAPAPATNFQMQPLDLPEELPGSQGLTPLTPPSVPGGSGGTLPGVFENQPDG